MKKTLAVLFALLLFALAACARTPAEPGGTSAPEDAIMLRLVSGAGTKTLVFAGSAAGEVYTAGADGLTVFQDGKESDPARLKNGMRLALDPDVTILETFPAQLVGAKVHAQSAPDDTDPGDLCGLYLGVLEDLWQEGAGLTGDIRYVSVDLSGAPGGLTDGEKQALAWIFASRKNAEALSLSYEELVGNGYIEAKSLYWENGVLLRVTAPDGGKSDDGALRFNASLWRAGDGAVFYLDCKAERGQDFGWKPYKVGNFAVS